MLPIFLLKISSINSLGGFPEWLERKTSEYVRGTKTNIPTRIHNTIPSPPKPLLESLLIAARTPMIAPVPILDDRDIIRELLFCARDNLLFSLLEGEAVILKVPLITKSPVMIIKGRKMFHSDDDIL